MNVLSLAYLDAYDADGALVGSTSYTINRYMPGPDESCVDWDRDGVCDTNDLCLGTGLTDAEPGVPIEWLGAQRWADLDGDGAFDSGKGLAGYTLTDTAGCSCAQILDEIGGGRGHEKFGCTTGIMKRWMSHVEAEGY